MRRDVVLRGRRAWALRGRGWVRVGGLARGVAVVGRGRRRRGRLRLLLGVG